MRTLTSVAVALVILSASWPAHAQLTGTDRGSWISQLKSQGDHLGDFAYICCDDSDAEEDVYWEANPDGTYRVFVLGVWIDVPKHALVIVPNLIGVAKLWLQNAHYDADGKLIAHGGVRCFLPGAAY